MSKRYKAKRRWRYNHRCRECHKVCSSTDKYWLPDSDPRHDKPDDILCAECASCWYCLTCGAFSAGVESFDFLHRGRCDNCQSEFEAEMEQEDSWEDDYSTHDY